MANLKEISNDDKQIIYFILQNKYLEIMGKGNASDLEILKETYNIFPQKWAIEYSLDRKIQLLGNAIKENKNLIEIAELEKNKISK